MGSHLRGVNGDDKKASVILTLPRREPLFLDSLGDGTPRPIVLHEPLTRTRIIVLVLAAALLGAGAWSALTNTAACSTRLEAA